MNVTASALTKGAGAAAAVAGSIFIAVQFGHPGPGTFTTETAQWVARSLAKSVMATLALAGITGMYLRQRREVGLVGLTGYLLFAFGYLTMFVTEAIAATVLPNLVDSEPAFVNDVVAAAMGISDHGDVGGLQTLFSLTGAGYMLGGLLFGIAMFRAAVLPRWASALLAVSTISTVALAFLPVWFSRPFAVPDGIAMIALGLALWRNPGHAAAHQSVPVTAVPQPA